mmetsp:Transcript_16447/g.26496  ORF Transcript_16447/g.26496 Transcript_16447/m.26496 type:complete len:80 (+) Transcript_16447:85-324(+)
MSSKCGLGTGPMWSGCARVTPEVVTDAGSNESDNLEYALFDVEPLEGTARDKNSTAAEEEAVDEEMPTTAAACAACSMG